MWLVGVFLCCLRFGLCFTRHCRLRCYDECHTIANRWQCLFDWILNHNQICVRISCKQYFIHICEYVKEKGKQWVITFYRYMARVSLPQFTIIGTANAQTKKSFTSSKTNSLGIFECKINSVVNWKRRTQAIQQFNSFIAEGSRSSELKVVHRLKN